MGFFKKDRPVIVPVASKFDRQWSDEFDRDVFARSEVDATNEAAREMLYEKRMILMLYYGETPMKRLGCDWAVSQFQSYILQDDATPWGAASLIVGFLRMQGAEDPWVEKMEEKLELDRADLAKILAENFNSTNFDCPICSSQVQRNNPWSHWQEHISQVPPGNGDASGCFTYECVCGPCPKIWDEDRMLDRAIAIHMHEVHSIPLPDQWTGSTGELMMKIQKDKLGLE